MKGTKLDEKNKFAFEGIFDEGISASGSLEKIEDKELQTLASTPKGEFLDKMLSLIKWVFLYLPGVACLHLAMMGLALVIYLGDFGTLDLLVLVGFIAFGAFLTMFGLGKLQDLKYLKTVLTILGVSFLLGVFSDILAIFIKGDFWAFYTRLTFPLVVLIGFLSKRNIDKDDEVKEDDL